MSAIGHQPSSSSAGLTPESPLDVSLNAIPCALVLMNSEGRVALANEFAERLFGYSPGSLVGKPVEALLSPRSRNAHPPDGHSETATGLSGVRLDQSEFPMEITRNPLPRGAGTLMVIRDVTEHQRLQQQLKNESAALEAARQEFHAFSHSISHDLRAPLRAIDGFATMLRRLLGEQLSTESTHALNRVQENVAKMSRLIDGLLDFSTLSWVALTKKKLHPESIAQKSFQGLSFSESGRRVDFSVGELPACEADAALLRRLFDNLLSNSLKFTRKQNPTVIRVGSRRENGETVYFVQDNGVGFDMEYSGKLFHVFQRLHSASEFEGTGTGLAIVQRIVQRHGGRVWAEGRVDGGATFYFTLGNSGHGHSA